MTESCRSKDRLRPLAHAHARGSDISPLKTHRSPLPPPPYQAVQPPSTSRF